MIYLIYLKAKFNKASIVCIGIIIFFSIINFIDMKNYYDEMYNQYEIENNNFEDKLKKENGVSRDFDLYDFNEQGLDINEQEINEQEIKKPENLKLNSLSALLMDGDNNRVLYELNGYKEMPMASTTKIMTCIIALEQGNLNDIISVSSYAASMPDVQLNIRKGEEYYLKDLLYSLMLESHNDVAVAIAEHIGGSVEGFATLMNDKARELGCNNTNFITPNGLDAEGHYTSARDLAVISSYAINNKDFIDITNTSSYQFKEVNNARSFTVTNKNKFLYMMDGAIGIKTGFTGKAGYCFVGAIKRPDRTLISVVLGCGWPPSKNLKWTDTKRLMTYGIENYIRKQIYLDKELGPLYVEDGQISLVNLSVDGDMNILLRDDERVRIDYIIPDKLDAPIERGQEVGCVKYYIDDKLYSEVPVLAENTSARIDYSFCFMRIFKLWSLQ